jgi:hypothetical protein
VTGEGFMLKVLENGELDPHWQGPNLRPLFATVTKESIYALPDVSGRAQPLTWKMFHDGRLDPSFAHFAGNVLDIYARESRLVVIGKEASYVLYPNGAIERPLPILESSVIASAMQPDGKILSASDYDARISRWNADGLKRRGSIDIAAQGF